MKKMLSVILCVLMLSGMCACGGSNSNQALQTPVSPGNSTSEIEEITFSLGDVSGTGTFLEQNAQFFSQKVSELSDGKMKVEIFSDGLLGTEDALMTNIQTGALEMANFSSTFTNLVKSAGIFDFPYLVTDRDQLALLEEAGIIDVIRTPSNSLRVKTFEAFGATPISISFSELYQSLSQHICDAQENPLATIVSSQFYDYQSCLCISNHVYTPGWICMNLDLYNSLSDAQRAVIDEAGALTSAHVLEAGAKADEENLQVCKDKGMQVTYADVEEFRNVVLPLWDKFADSVGGIDFVNAAKAALGY